MSVKVRRVEVSLNSVNPELQFRIEVLYDSSLEIPFSIKGVLSTSDGKHIAYLDEYVNSDSERILEGKILGKNKMGNYRDRERELYIELNAHLTSKSIEYIELSRHKHYNKNVDLNLTLIVKTLQIKLTSKEKIQTLDDNSIVDLLAIKIRNEAAYVTIPQSEWLQRFAEPLGIGKFLLLELQLPPINPLYNEWKEMLDRLLGHVQQMEDQIKQGRWYDVMITARRVMEIALPKKSENKEAFKKLFTQNFYSDEGYNHLYKGIEGIFLYASKFIHDKDKQDQYNPIPIVQKEDAYLIYGLTIALVNLINQKINSTSSS
jgi:hypothetical protein